MKEFKELFNGSENRYLICTEKGVAFNGNQVQLLSLLNMLVRELSTKIDEQILRESFELSFISDEELEKQAKESLKKIKELNKLFEKLGDLFE